MKPKEGTILTVASGIADKAAELALETEDLEEFIPAVIEHADEVLQKTPEMLPVLKEAGVVDSGGQGLLEVIRGAYDAFLGKEIDYSAIAPAAGNSTAVKVSVEEEKEIKFGYCTEFIIMLDKPYDQQKEHEFKAFLESIGDSIVVVSDDEVVKVHVHTNDPGLAIQRALTYGALSNMKIDNMRLEHEEKLIKDASRIAAEKKAEEKAAAKEQAEKIGNLTVTIKTKAGDGGKIFGSITSKDIAEGLKSQHGIEVDKKKIQLSSPIKQTGEMSVDIKLYSEVSAELKVKIEAE